MVEYKRFCVSVRNNGKVIATEKRKLDIDKRIIKPWEVMIIRADNMTEFYKKLTSTFGCFKHHRRRGNWIINYDSHELKNEESFHEVPKGYYSKPKENKENKEETKVEETTQEVSATTST